VARKSPPRVVISGLDLFFRTAYFDLWCFDGSLRVWPRVAGRAAWRMVADVPSGLRYPCAASSIDCNFFMRCQILPSIRDLGLNTLIITLLEK
jgi:hypothetical protein